MKTMQTLLLLLFSSGTLQLLAQDCKTAYYFTKGKEIIFVKHDKNGNPAGKEVGTVVEVSEVGNKLTSKYKVIKYEAGGKVKEEGTADVVCDNGGVKLGFQIPATDGQKSSDASFNYPAGMKPGQALEANMEMNIKGKTNGKKLDVSFKVANRKVVANEQVKTPAGNFSAVKIQYDMDVKFKVIGIAIPMKLKIYEWYSPGVGLVKSESYNKDGNLEESSVLSSIK